MTTLGDTFIVGAHVKVLASGELEEREIPSGLTMTASKMVRDVKRSVKGGEYDVVSIGYPARSEGLWARAFALQFAIHEPQLSACVVNYGTLPTNPVDIRESRAPEPRKFGALDRGSPPAEARTFERVMKSLNKSLDIKIVIGAGHAFQNPDNQRDYRPEDSAGSWHRILAFFAQATGTDVSMRPDGARVYSIRCG